jgi:5-methylcytosine-specific restriction endonuclease McrA
MENIMNFSDIPLLKIGNTIQLAGAVYAGEDNTYLLLLPSEALEGPIRTIEMSPEDWKACLRQSDLLEVEVTDGIEKAIRRKCERQVDQHLAWRCFIRDYFKCRYCGRGDAPLTVDHLIVWEEGGPTIMDNLLSACRKCNKARGNTPYPEWLDSPTYDRLSKNLAADVRAANYDLVSTLDKIQRVKVIRSR